MKTFIPSVMLGLLAWSATVSWADDCDKDCHVTCVFPGSKSCMFEDPVFQTSCLEDFDFCVASCLKRCRCKKRCEDSEDRDIKDIGEVDICVDACFNKAVNKLSNVAAQRKTYRRIDLLKLDFGHSLLGEQGHLD